jgi:hypothetical protein
MHLRQHSADKRRRLEHKVQECLVVRDRLYEIVRLELRHSTIQKRPETDPGIRKVYHKPSLREQRVLYIPDR